MIEYENQSLMCSCAVQNKNLIVANKKFVNSKRNDKSVLEFP